MWFSSSRTINLKTSTDEYDKMLKWRPDAPPAERIGLSKRGLQCVPAVFATDKIWSLTF
jgi:hypothetical protein